MPAEGDARQRRSGSGVAKGGGCYGRPVLEELLSSGARRQGVSLLSSLWVAVQGRGREEEGEGIGRMRQGRLAALWEDERERWARSLAARVRESAGWASVQMGLGPNGAAGCWTLSSLTL